MSYVIASKSLAEVRFLCSGLALCSYTNMCDAALQFFLSLQGLLSVRSKAADRGNERVNHHGKMKGSGERLPAALKGNVY